MKTKKSSGEKSTGKRVFRGIAAVVAVAAICAAVLVWVLPHLPEKPQQSSAKHYRGVLELWNVESFEGGSGSRSAWITSRAAIFEKAHEGLFVHVTNLTAEQLQAKLDGGENFDLVCFSRGAGCLLQEKLQPYTGSVADIKNNFLVSGEVDNGVYALPLYCGSYCLFARQSQLPQNADLVKGALSYTYTRKVGKNTFQLTPIVCGFTPYNSPLSALAMSGGRGKVAVSEDISQYQAYEDFLAGKTAVTLLGTQRDLYRLGKREEMGKLEALVFAPLCGYTDLVQYLAISADCGDKVDCCNEFLQYMVSQDSQQSLTGINVFSVLEQTFYTSSRYLQCEQGLSQAYVPNVFGDSESLLAQRKTAVATLGM